MKSFETVFAKVALHVRCGGGAKDALSTSLKKISSNLSSADTSIQPFLDLLELQWDSSSPIGVLYSGKFSKKKEKLKALVEAIEADPILSAESLRVKQVRAGMLSEKNLDAETTMFRALIGDYENLVLNELSAASNATGESSTHKAFIYDKFQEHFSCAYENFIKCSEFTVSFTFVVLEEISSLMSSASDMKKKGA
jgi:hypothetical protein